MPTTIAAPKERPAAEKDFLPLQGTDYIEFYVGNAKQAAHFYKTAFGFQSLAYSGPETGTKERASYAIRQNQLTFVLTTALRPDNPIADNVARHGDGVKAIALKVKDATSAWEETTSRGGNSFLEPMTLTDGDGQLVMSGIHTYGDTVHLFIERDDYSGVFMPGFEKWESNYNPAETGLLYCDHCVGNVGWNQMNPWVKFYEDVMGFRNILTFDDKDISTEYSALMSKVMSSGNGFVKFPINEPAEGKKKSQVEEYLDFYEAGRGPADALFRDHPAQRREEFRQRQFQSALRSDRARTGSTRQFIEMEARNRRSLTLIFSLQKGEAERGVCVHDIAEEEAGRLSSLKEERGTVRS